MNRLIENQQRTEETKMMLLATSRFDHRDAFFIQFAEIERVERMHQEMPKKILKKMPKTQDVWDAGIEAPFALREIEEEMDEKVSELEWIDNQSQDAWETLPDIWKCEDQSRRECVAARGDLNPEVSEFSSDSDGAGVLLLPFSTKRKERAAAQSKIEHSPSNPFSDSNRIFSLASDSSSDSSGGGIMPTPGPVGKTVHREETDWEDLDPNDRHAFTKAIASPA
jgi:hypothetical protein